MRRHSAQRHGRRTSKILGVLLGVAAAGCGGPFDNRADDNAGEEVVVDCPLYCAVVMRRCKGSMRQYSSVEACTEACTAYPIDGVTGSVSGNTLQCRFTFALAARKTTHYAFCRNAGPSGGVNCK